MKNFYNNAYVKIGFDKLLKINKLTNEKICIL